MELLEPNFGFQCSGLRIPQAKIPRIPEYGLLSMGRSLPVLDLNGSHVTASDLQRGTVSWSAVNGADEQDL